MATNGKKVLQIGLGGFGKNHLKAWHEMGMGETLYIAELNPKLHADTRQFSFPSDRLTTDYRKFIDQVDIVDIVTPSTSHFDLCRGALAAGKHVFVEKPMTMTSVEAEALAKQVQDTGLCLQVGYYYRFHPASLFIKKDLAQLGTLRYLTGNFMGFKRARTDVGVTHTDGIHFIDLFNWLVGAPPENIYAVVRDHFKRGLEDFSVVILRYPNGTIAKVESGYIQPGRWHDKVVPNAMTSKEIVVCGQNATAEVDFETENLTWHDVRHEFREPTWYPVSEGSRQPIVGTASPIKMIADELKAFIASIDAKTTPGPNVIASGTVLAKVMEALYESARANKAIDLTWTEAERNSFDPSAKTAALARS